MPNGRISLRNSPRSGSNTFPFQTIRWMSFAAGPSSFVPGVTRTVPSASPRGMSPASLLRKSASRPSRPHDHVREARTSAIHHRPVAEDCGNSQRAFSGGTLVTLTAAGSSSRQAVRGLEQRLLRHGQNARSLSTATPATARRGSRDKKARALSSKTLAPPPGCGHPRFLWVQRGRGWVGDGVALGSESHASLESEGAAPVTEGRTLRRSTHRPEEQDFARPPGGIPAPVPNMEATLHKHG